MGFVIKTDYGAFIDDKGSYVDFCITNVERARKYKLSEAIAVKEKHQSTWRKFNCEIFEVDFCLGDKVNI